MACKHTIDTVRRGVKASTLKQMSREDKPDLTQWQPRALIDEARGLPLADFLLSCESAFMLIIMLATGDSELSLGLSASEHSDRDGLAFRTATPDLKSTMTGEVAQARSASAGRTLAFNEQTSERRLPMLLSRASCYVVPICKRAEVSFLHQVSIGRARNHDIVLRHRSVSKFHAWFEVTPDARLFVKDCDSSNHTFINDERVLDRAEVHPGDSLRFGSVEGRLCTSEGFWRLVHGA